MFLDGVGVVGGDSVGFEEAGSDWGEVTCLVSQLDFHFLVT